ncbi:hypothetical protein H8959_019317 [Pygathrix nigripes]
MVPAQILSSQEGKQKDSLNPPELEKLVLEVAKEVEEEVEEVMEEVPGEEVEAAMVEEVVLEVAMVEEVEVAIAEEVVVAIVEEVGATMEEEVALEEEVWVAMVEEVGPGEEVEAAMVEEVVLEVKVEAATEVVKKGVEVVAAMEEEAENHPIPSLLPQNLVTKMRQKHCSGGGEPVDQELPTAFVLDKPLMEEVTGKKMSLHPDPQKQCWTGEHHLPNSQSH